MKVALLCNNFPPEFRGGTERVVLALSTALRRVGHEIVVVTGSEEAHRGEDAIAEDGEGLPVWRVPRLPDEYYGLEISRPRVLDVVTGLMRRESVDVVHLHHWATLSLSVMRRVRELGLGGVATLHDMWTTCGRFFRRPPEGVACPQGDDRAACGPCVRLSFSAEPLWKLRLGVADRDRQVRAELAAAHALTAPSRACAAAIARHAPWAGPIEVVPHGLLEPVTESAAAASDAAGAPLRVGTFGNLVAEKGVLLLVEAMAGVPGELHLHGPFLEPEFEREVRALAERGGVTLRCHGGYDPGGAHPAAALDVAVFPSLCEETYGLVVEEALARGVPVVVSDRGALAERIGDGGLVAAAGKVEALRAALLEVADPARRAALRAGIPGRFSTIDDAARRYSELYGDAVERAR